MENWVFRLNPQPRRVLSPVRQTDNIAIEYRCDGKPSGISTTEADFWVHELLRDGQTLVYLMFPPPHPKGATVVPNLREIAMALGCPEPLSDEGALAAALRFSGKGIADYV
jgi:hypothetical protein